ncbi:MAG: hypothetical protein QM761_08735 [Pseudoxanthomonas sp.]
MKSTFVATISITLLLIALPSHAADKKPAAKPQLKEAPSLDLAGISFGQPVTMKECPSEIILRDYRSYKSDMGLKPEDKPCWKHTYRGKPLEPLPQNGKINIITSTDYPGVKDITAQIVNGSVEGITLITYGKNWQDRIFDNLSQKYGTPTTNETTTEQNMMGAKFSNIVAEWKFTNLNVSFAGIMSDIHTGIVSATTPTGERADEVERQEKKNSEPKL